MAAPSVRFGSQADFPIAENFAGARGRNKWNVPEITRAQYQKTANAASIFLAGRGVNVRFGSFAAVRHRISPMAAIGGKADVRSCQKLLK